MRIEADNLQDAFQKAADKLSCSVTELDIQVIQHPSKGILGLFKKSAIIEAYKEGTRPKEKVAPPQPKKSKKAESKKPQSPKSETLDSPRKNEKRRPRKEKVKAEDMSVALPKIQKGVNALVENSCFDISHVEVKAYNDETVLIELNGEDAALLIGKEGYRYKAFSYLLYNWINIKYGLGIRLEIAEFLKNQEVMIEKYLIPVIERIENNGRGQTKPLDGVLIKIALERLRAQFPDKYVGIKTGREGAKFIVVNSFNKKQ